MRRYMGMVGAGWPGSTAREERRARHILYAIIVFARRRKYGHGNGDRQVEERFLGKKIGVEKGNGGRKWWRTVDNSQDGIVPRAKNRSVLACYRMKEGEREGEREWWTTVERSRRGGHPPFF